MNPMKKIRIRKLTVNVGTGKDQKELDRGLLLIKHITGLEGVKTITNKRIPGWGLRPGLAVGCKLTLRKDKAVELAKKFLETKENLLEENNFDGHGNISFGITEYIEIPGIEYNHDIGMMGFQVCITLERPGYRLTKRRRFKKSLPRNHVVDKQEAMQFMKDEFNIKVGEL